MDNPASAHIIEFFCIIVIAFSTVQEPHAQAAMPIKPGHNIIYEIPRIDSAVKIDGRINELFWSEIEPLPVVAQQPVFGREPSQKTEYLLAYDDDYLYVAGRCYDTEPEKILSTSLKRDDWKGSSDAFGVFIDSFDDNENALGFVTTPNGTRIDVAISDDADGEIPISMSWNTFWEAAATKNSDGWFAEMRIPFSSLRFQEQNGDVVMSLSVYRYIARTPERIIFPAIPQTWGRWSFLKPSKMHPVIFKNLRSRKPFYVTPYLLGGIGHGYELNSAGTAYSRTDDPTHDAGLDIKYGLTNNMTLDLTFNTDFAQVEADDEEVNLTRFSLYFPEKRLFFLERSSVFEFNFGGSNRIFYSRRIGIQEEERVRILGGGRLSGRVGQWDIGALTMQTEAKGSLPSENFGVLRMRRRVLNPYSYVGGIMTSRIGDDGSWNAVYGLDSIIRAFGDDYISLKWAQTFEEGNDNEPYSLDPARLTAGWERRSYTGVGYEMSYSRSGNAYNPGVGFAPRENYTRYGYNIMYGWIPGELSNLLRHRVRLGGALYMNSDSGVTESSEFGPEWEFSTKADIEGSITVKSYYENVPEAFSISDDAEIPEGTYTYYGIETEFETPDGNLYNLETSFEAGTFYDGSRFSAALEPTAQVTDNIELRFTYELNRLSFPDRDLRFFSHIVRLRSLIMFNSALSLTAFVQYNSAADAVINNIRFRYNPREGNDLYLVYDEGFNTDRHREFPVLPLTQNRTVMVKYSYMFNL